MITLTNYHLVRVGVLGHVGRFLGQDTAVYARGRRVLCRTNRGLEVGEVLSHVATASRAMNSSQTDGSLVRAMTAEDELLQARLRKNRDEAYRACTDLLQAQDVGATLIDVEQLFDSSCIYFYFLGQIPEHFQPLVDRLAETYESRVQFRDFAAAVETGCGPNCGTEEASGCGVGCDTCSIMSACKSSS